MVTLTSARRAKRIVHSIRSRRRRQRLQAPLIQLAVAVGVMVGGAALIGAWMIGVVLIIGGLLVAGDAFLRDIPAKNPTIIAHDDVLERYRRAR
jgi:uncharacterized membrane protein YidH (DUF202 family)